MALLRLHPARLTTRALDGAFGTAEIPALIGRPALYSQSGRLVVRQAPAQRALTFERGVLVAVDSTEPGESLLHMLSRQVPADDRRLVAARRKARQQKIRLADTVRPMVHDDALVDTSLRSQAGKLVDGCVSGGEAMVWFERRGEAGKGGLDLQVFRAVWRSVQACWPEVDRYALGRHVAAGGLRPVDAAEAFLRSVHADDQLLRLVSGGTPATDVDFSRLGALVLCGLVESRAAAIEMEVAGVAVRRDTPRTLQSGARRRSRFKTVLAVLMPLLAAALVASLVWWRGCGPLGR